MTMTLEEIARSVSRVDDGQTLLVRGQAPDLEAGQDLADAFMRLTPKGFDPVAIEIRTDPARGMRASVLVRYWTLDAIHAAKRTRANYNPDATPLEGR
jgi:hypothetical protein